MEHFASLKLGVDVGKIHGSRVATRVSTRSATFGAGCVGCGWFLACDVTNARADLVFVSVQFQQGSKVSLDLVNSRRSSLVSMEIF